MKILIILNYCKYQTLQFICCLAFQWEHFNTNTISTLDNKCEMTFLYPSLSLGFLLSLELLTPPLVESTFSHLASYWFSHNKLLNSTFHILTVHMGTGSESGLQVCRLLAWLIFSYFQNGLVSWLVQSFSADYNISATICHWIWYRYLWYPWSPPKSFDFSVNVTSTSE